MLTDFPIHATAAAVDLARARRWYEERLGITPERDDPGGVWYRFAADTWLYLYATPSAGTAQNTIAGWTVKDIGAVMADLRAFFGKQLFSTIVPRNIRLGEAPSHGQPILLYDIKSKGAESYIRLAKEIIHGTEKSVGKGIERPVGNARS